MFVDSHCHIDLAEYDEQRADVIARAGAAGIEAILVVGTGNPQRGELERAAKLAEDHNAQQAVSGLDGHALDVRALDIRAPRLFATIGLHPHDARLFDEKVAAHLKEVIETRADVVALGEIGLDYHYDNSPRDVQRAVFARQLRMARELNLPVVIHTREAEADTIEMLEAELSGYERTGGCGVMHCFGGSLELAERALRLGFLISFAGNLTFRRAEELRATARALPLDRLLIETDAPYLAPVPHRGKRNEPAFVVEAARTLARVHETEIETIARHTTANFYNLFDIPFNLQS